MSAVKKKCDICIGQKIFSPSEADYYSDLNGMNICSNHLERSAYEILDDRQPLRFCSAYILADGRRRCKLLARHGVVGSDGIAVCGKHVRCLGHSTTTSLPCKMKDCINLNSAFLCRHHAEPIPTQTTRTLNRHLMTVSSSPTQARTPTRNLATFIPSTVRTIIDVPPLTPEQREQIVTVISEVVNQLNDLSLAVRGSENIPVASQVETAETQSSVGPFSSRMR
jgi:hypothetical protein